MAREPTTRGDELTENATELSRRDWLKTTGAGASVAVGGLTLGASPVVGATEGGPVDSETWQLVFEDRFEGETLDADSWDVGFGWGDTANDDLATVTEDNVVVDDGTLRLLVTHGGGGAGDVYQGAVNSRDRQYFGPGHYFEARIRMPGREGLLPAFWSKPNSEAWPPEIDFVELFQQGEDVYADRHQAHFNVHWSSSGTVGDESTHTHDSLTYDTDTDLTESYNVYGCAWLEDRIDFYFNGEYVGSRDSQSMMDAVNAGAPFYMMFTTHVNRIGSADLSAPWEEEMAVDWCRVWEQGDAPSDGPEEADDDPEEADDDPEEADDDSEDGTGGRYVEIRSAGGDAVRYEFTAFPGGVEHDPSTGTGQEWVSDDEVYGWGTTSTDTGRVDAFQFDGEITGFGWDAPVAVLVDGEAVDPASFGPVDPAETPWDDGDGDDEEPAEREGPSEADGEPVDDADGSPDDGDEESNGAGEEEDGNGEDDEPSDDGEGGNGEGDEPSSDGGRSPQGGDGGGERADLEVALERIADRFGFVTRRQP